MKATVSFFASSKYGYSGQYIARITGRDPKFTFSRDFVGQRSGKFETNYVTDEPGLYIECCVDKRGKTEWFYIVYDLPGSGIAKANISRDEAIIFAKRLNGEQLDWQREILTRRLRIAEANNQESIFDDQLGLKAGKVRRGDLVKALKNYLGIKQEPETNSGQDELIAKFAEFTTEQIEAELARRSAILVNV